MMNRIELGSFSHIEILTKFVYPDDPRNLET